MRINLSKTLQRHDRTFVFIALLLAPHLCKISFDLIGVGCFQQQADKSPKLFHFEMYFQQKMAEDGSKFEQKKRFLGTVSTLYLAIGLARGRHRHVLICVLRSSGRSGTGGPPPDGKGPVFTCSTRPHVYKTKPCLPPLAQKPEPPSVSPSNQTQSSQGVFPPRSLHMQNSCSAFIWAQEVVVVCGELCVSIQLNGFSDLGFFFVLSCGMQDAMFPKFQSFYNRGALCKSDFSEEWIY